ncbi:hypothetical protein Taro_043759 [Colocasia esculenta]|uniref:Uncharacterized protein n=1 Tax=Colocasia esculenta TaxID=4460 RepID=A0A843X4J3_COLES|nr:hypothetical protein [Colocasia esculenta]
MAAPSVRGKKPLTDDASIGLGEGGISINRPSPSTFWRGLVILKSENLRILGAFLGGELQVFGAFVADLFLHLLFTFGLIDLVMPEFFRAHGRSRVGQSPLESAGSMDPTRPGSGSAGSDSPSRPDSAILGELAETGDEITIRGSHVFPILVGVLSTIAGGISYCLIKAAAKASDQPVNTVLAFGVLAAPFSAICAFSFQEFVMLDLLTLSLTIVLGILAFFAEVAFDSILMLDLFMNGPRSLASIYVSCDCIVLVSQIRASSQTSLSLTRLVGCVLILASICSTMYSGTERAIDTDSYLVVVSSGGRIRSGEGKLEPSMDDQSSRNDVLSQNRWGNGEEKEAAENCLGFTYLLSYHRLKVQVLGQLPMANEGDLQMAAGGKHR